MKYIKPDITYFFWGGRYLFLKFVKWNLVLVLILGLLGVGEGFWLSFIWEGRQTDIGLLRGRRWGTTKPFTIFCSSPLWKIIIVSYSQNGKSVSVCPDLEPLSTLYPICHSFHKLDLTRIFFFIAFITNNNLLITNYKLYNLLIKLQETTRQKANIFTYFQVRTWFFFVLTLLLIYGNYYHSHPIHKFPFDTIPSYFRDFIYKTNLWETLFGFI